VSFILNDKKAKSVMDSIQGTLFTSRLGFSEVTRSIHKFDPKRIKDAQDFFRGVTLIAISDEVLNIVEGYSKLITLKTSDALHVATAELVLEDGDCLVTFDRQMATNAEHLGIRVLAP
jgi:predicted nucleic acid-binding protein